MISNDRGKFITFEGGEGVGKSTNIEVVKSYLAERKIDFIHTREPGGTVISEEIRQVLLHKHDETMDPLAELLLIFAARTQHLSALIEPALESGRWVLCDRFTDATYAYQGAGRQLPIELIGKLETMVQGELRPDLTIILDVDPRVGLERARRRGEPDRFEEEVPAFFNAVRSCYLDIAKAEPGRCAVINAGGERAVVRRELLGVLHERLGISG